MPTIVTVPDVGDVEFPDSMDDAAILQAIHRDILKIPQAQPQQPQELPASTFVGPPQEQPQPESAVRTGIKAMLTPLALGAEQGKKIGAGFMEGLTSTVGNIATPVARAIDTAFLPSEKVLGPELTKEWSLAPATQKFHADISDAWKTLAETSPGNETATEVAKFAGGFGPIALAGLAGPAGATAAFTLQGYETARENAEKYLLTHGADKETAETAAHQVGLLSGAISGALTHYIHAVPGLKNLGTEQLDKWITDATLRQIGPSALKLGLQNIVKSAANDAITQSAFTAGDLAVAKATYEPELTAGQAASQIAKSATGAALFGGLMRGARETGRVVAGTYPKAQEANEGLVRAQEALNKQRTEEPNAWKQAFQTPTENPIPSGIIGQTVAYDAGGGRKGVGFVTGATPEGVVTIRTADGTGEFQLHGAELAATNPLIAASLSLRSRQEPPATPSEAKPTAPVTTAGAIPEPTGPPAVAQPPASQPNWIQQNIDAVMATLHPAAKAKIEELAADRKTLAEIVQTTGLDTDTVRYARLGLGIPSQTIPSLMGAGAAQPNPGFEVWLRNYQQRKANATQLQQQQGGVQPERPSGNAGGQTAETGGGNRILGPAPGQTEAQPKPATETVIPPQDKLVGQNAAGEQIYERANGQFYRMRRDRADSPHGYPDFGGDLAPVPASSKAEEVAAAGEQTLPNPTQAQKESGNYPKGHVKIDGLDISIENKVGSVRSGVGPDGKPWSVTMQNAYGYIKGTKGRDKDHIDIYIGPKPEEPYVWVIDQQNPDTKEFDEHKTFLGFASEQDVRNAYNSAFSDGRAPERIRGITRFTKDEFKQWLKTNTTNPLSEPTAAAVRIMGTDSVQVFDKTIGGVRYELFQETAQPHERSAIRITDKDTGNVVTLKQYPTYESAKAEFFKTTEAAEKSEQPAKSYSQPTDSELLKRWPNPDGVMGMQEGASKEGRKAQRQELERLYPDYDPRRHDAFVSRYNKELERANQYALGHVGNEPKPPIQQPAKPPRAAGDLEGMSDEELDAMLDAASAPTTAPALTPAKPKPAAKSPTGTIRRKSESSKIGALREEIRKLKQGLPVAEDMAIYDKGRSLDELQRQITAAQDKLRAATSEAESTKVKTASEIIADAAKLGVTGIDEAIKGLHDLFGGGSTLGTLGPGIDEGTYAKAKPHFETAYNNFKQAGRSLQEFLKYIFDKFGQNVRPYVRRFIKELQAAPAAEPVNELRDLIGSDETTAQKSQRMRNMADARGITLKDMQELVEAEVVKIADEIASNPHLLPQQKFEAATELYSKQPLFSARTSTSVADQAYSTPIPLAMALRHMALVDTTTDVYDPTGGNGMLMIGSNHSGSSANELNPKRAEAIRKLGIGNVTENDATKFGLGRKVRTVLTNPPFGTIPNVNYHGFGIRKLEHLIALKALEAMDDNGTAGIIIGANREEGRELAKGAEWIFENYLYGHYNVVDNFEVSGDLYGKQGAQWPVRVLVVAGRRAVPVVADLAPRTVDRLNTWDEVWDRAKKVRNETARIRQGLVSERPGGIPAGPQPEPQISPRPANVPGRPGVTAAPAGGGSKPGGTGGREPAPEGTTAAGKPPVATTGTHVEHEDTISPPAEPGVGGKPPPPVEGGNRPGVEAPITPAATGEEEGGESKPGVVPKPPAVVGQERQIPYVPRSNGTPFGTLTPRTIGIGTHGALDALKARVGDIDEFVAGRLNMPVESMREGLAADQIDGVALAIDNIEHGGALIIGDETGIGKGRQAAAVMRYAVLQGKVPIFFTKDPKLFTDMYGDLRDIGTTLKPLIFGDASKASIVNESGDVIVRAPGKAAQDRIMADILRDGLEKSGYDAIFSTYSQVNEQNARQAFLETLANKHDSIIVLDEAHEAAGDSKSSMSAAFMSGGAVKRGSGSSQTTVTKMGLLQSAGSRPGRGGVVYLSATFAKRPDNMPLYFRTAISRAAQSFGQMTEAMKKGGVALQQAISEALASVGQYVRRERSFEGITYEPKKIVVPNQEEFVKKVDDVTEILSSIVAFSQAVRDLVEGSTAQSEEQISTTDFAAVVHNQVAQLLLSAKADEVIKEAIEAHKNGKKPVIALMNTMESFLGDFVDDNGIKPGDKISLRWNELLTHALRRQLRKKEKLPNGDSVITYLNPDEDLPPELLNRYNQIKADAAALKIDFPVSPIDYILQQLRAAGIKIGELTGRESGITYTDPHAGVGTYTVFKKANKNRLVNDFNGGALDGLLLNASGSTGLSIHASKRFADQRHREMIIAQPALDINTFVQTLGRIKRTGMLPGSASYLHMILPLNAELRPAAVTTKKMKSLNANTTAEAEGGVKIDSEDFLNKYGDRVVAEYLNANQELARQLGIDIEEKEDGTVKVPEDVARKFAGRMSLLPDAQQGEAYAHILPAYRDLISQLKATGDYDLDIVVHHDWDGVRKEDLLLSQGKDESSIFTASLKAERWEITDNRHVPTGEEMAAEFKKNLGTREALQEKWKAFKDQADSRIQAGIERAHRNLEAAENDTSEFATMRQTSARAELDSWNKRADKWDHWATRMDSILAMAGDPVHVTNAESGEVYDGLMTDVKFPDLDVKLQTAPSQFKFRYLVDAPGGRVYVTGAGLQTGGDFTQARSERTLRDFKGSRAGQRYERYFVTGNPIAAYDATGGRGKMVRFNSRDGETITGLLMPRNWDISKLARDPRRDLTDAAAAEHFLKSDYYSVVQAPSGKVSIVNRSGELTIWTPSAKTTGGTFYLDPELRQMLGDFTKVSSRMRTHVPSSKLRDVLDRVIRLEGSKLQGTLPGNRNAIPNVQAANSASADIVSRLQARKRKPGGEQLSTLIPGLDPETSRSVWNTAIDIAVAAIKAGRAIKAAIDMAIAHIRSAAKGEIDDIDEAAMRSRLESEIPKTTPTAPPPLPISSGEQAAHQDASLSDPQLQDEIAQAVDSSDEPTRTKVFNAMDTIIGRDRLTPEVVAAGQVHSRNFFGKLGLQVQQDEHGYWKLADETTDSEAQGRKMVEDLRAELQHKDLDAAEKGYLGNLLNSIVVNMTPDRVSAFSPETRAELYSLAQGERSHRGLLLGMLSQGNKTVEYVARNIDAVLQRTYSDAFGGDTLRKFVDGIRKGFGGYFTGEVVKGVLEKVPELQDSIDRINAERNAEKLIPSLPELVRQILRTPLYRQSEIRERFVKLLTDNYDVNHELAAKAGMVLERAFSNRYKAAIEAAKVKALKALTPAELKELTKGKSTWKKIEAAVNSGLFETGQLLNMIAKSNGWKVMTPEIRTQMRNWVQQMQRLRELSPAEIREIEQFSDTPEKAQIEKQRALSDREALTRQQRLEIKKNIETMWSRLTHPLRLKDHAGNVVNAAYEWASALLLLKAGFPSRQTIDVLMQGAIHTPTRALQAAWDRIEINHRQGDNLAVGKEIYNALGSAYKVWLKSLRPAAAKMRAVMGGAAKARNVENLVSNIGLFERLAQKADELDASGEHVKANLLTLATWVKAARQFAAASDELQGVPAEYQELRQQVVTYLREHGKNMAEAEASADEIVKDPISEWKLAIEQAGFMADKMGLEYDPKRIRSVAEDIALARVYQRIREAGLPADDWHARNAEFRETVGWNNKEDTGLGGLVGAPLRALSKFGVKFPPAAIFSVAFGRFANAISISAVRAASMTPLGFFPGAFGVSKADIHPVTGIAMRGSPWYRTAADRRQRKVEATIGTALGAVAMALVATGQVAVQWKSPKDKDERELWLKQGHRPGTVEFNLPDGSFIPMSLTVGPMRPLAPYFVGMGALMERQGDIEKRQAKLNEEAKKQGLKPGKVNGLDFADLAYIAAQAAWSTMIGGRTATGLVGALTDYGIPNPRKAASAIVTAVVPGLAAIQEASRMAGIYLDPKMATFLDFLVPMETSAGRSLNMLGDNISTDNAVQRTMQVMTGGTGLPVHPNDIKAQTAYAALFNSGYRPPPIDPNKGYSIGGQFRPLTNAELAKFTQLRGQNLKASLAALGPAPTKEDAAAAFKTANEQALSQVGVSVESAAAASTPTQTASETSALPSGSTIRAPRMIGSAGGVPSAIGGRAVGAATPSTGGVRAPASGGASVRTSAPRLGTTRGGLRRRRSVPSRPSKASHVRSYGGTSRTPRSQRIRGLRRRLV